MNAWIDCMSDLDEDTGMSKIQVKSGELLLLCIEDSTDFKNRAPDLYDAMVEAIGFVNMRRLDPTASYASKTPVLGLLPIDSLE